MCKRFYTVDVAYGTGRIGKEFNTYEEAYDYMCKNYIMELNNGCKPTLYQILRHDVSNWGGATNTMICPTWN